MNHQRVILESSPYYLLLCLVIALALAFLMYRAKHPWNKNWNRVLFGVRSVLIFFLLFLLLGPIVKQIQNLFEKPLYVVLYDNSTSVRETTDSLTRQNLQQQLKSTQQLLEEKGYEVKVNNLDGEEVDQLTFNHTSTDITNALKKVSNRYEGKKLAGVLLVSDGIYNTGLSPLFASYNYPVNTIGIGDTVVKKDIYIKNIAYNKIAYQGNKFPVRVEVAAKNFDNENIRVSLMQRGKLIEQQSKPSKKDELLTFDFQPLATEQGIQKLDVVVEQRPGEANTQNNRGSIFVEVVEGKKKILIVSAAPHPDVKALREVIDKNSNYELILSIPGLPAPSKMPRPEEVDLAIFNQAPDIKGKTRDTFLQFFKSKSSLLMILGQQSDIRFLSQQNVPVKFDAIPRDYDEVTAIASASFSSFSVSPEASSIIADYPPVSVHFGKVRLPLSASPLLFQRIGSVTTEKPLLAVDNQDGRKIAVMLGEGFWRWRLNEYDRTENTAAFDEVFGKLIQYLSTTEDKRKFRSYPIQQEFSDTESVVFESQVYNDIFEPVYGNTINIDLTNEEGKKTSYSYVTNAGNIRYQIGGLHEGVYRYRSGTTIHGKTEEVRGEFAVTARQAELQNLTADFDLLRRLASATGGNFYKASNLDALQSDLSKTQATSVIHTEETYNALINIKLVFWLLLTLVTIEWFVRKYFGSY
jgi:hypothetical protein